ncbi:MAG: hypothetical protein KIT84_43560 [Labilithrix sp.]|nr:hypothetical protein [Labilithrix sp.]MCW5817957.1 hypothetical protein [Labilithrix sp.]
MTSAKPCGCTHKPSASSIGPRADTTSSAPVFAELEDRFLVVAVAHLRRHPTYWRRRLASVP